MSQICYAAFSGEFVKRAEGIFKKLGRDVYVTVWNPELAPELVRQGVAVLMGRGATAARIRDTIDLPVVEIPIPFEDMVNTLITASRYGKNIGVIGYNNLLNGLELLNPILNVNIRQAFAVDAEDTYRKILKQKEEGIDVIVGGVIQTRYAKELGLPFVRLELSEKALLYACDEAERLLVSVKAATRKAEEFKTILNTTKENYIAVDKKGEIVWMNHRAKGYLPNSGSRVYQRPLDEIFPSFAPIGRVLGKGEELLQETASVNGDEILYDMIPMTYRDGEIFGALVTFNDAGTITRGEHKIRDKRSQGFCATYSFKDICGNSMQLLQCLDFARRFAATDLSVLFLGESGSGKEMFAQSMHNASSRRSGPFVAVNCAALPEGLLESELFGYDEGAFTGARRSGKMGLFELAHNGTVFLDEIGEMPLAVQSRLLRVLQEKKVMRLGGDRVFHVNVRIFAATNKNLMEQVREHRFREDLFYRLNVLTLKIPALRERKEDIPELAGQFLKETGADCRLTSDALQALCAYGWPGNARQLRHFMEKVRIICDSPVISGEAVRFVIRNYEPSCEGRGAQEERQELTAGVVEAAIRKAGGNKAEAARILGIHRSTLWRYLKREGETDRT